MRGLNTVTNAGFIGSEIKFGTTKQGDQACSFMLEMKKSNSASTWVRVNVYGFLVSICEKVSRGNYVIVLGELMNRQRKYGEEESQTLTEVRAQEIILINKEKEDDKEGSEEAKQEITSVG